MRGVSVYAMLASVSVFVIFGLRNGRTVERCGVCLLGGCLTANGQSVDGDGRAERAVASGVPCRATRGAAVEGMEPGTLATVRALRWRRRRRSSCACLRYRWQTHAQLSRAERRTPKDCADDVGRRLVRTLSTSVAIAPIGVDWRIVNLPFATDQHAEAICW